MPRSGKGRATLSWGNAAASPRTTKHPQEAAALVAFIAGEAGQRRFMPLGQQVPALVPLSRSREFLQADRTTRAVALEALGVAKPLPKVPSFVEIDEQL